MIKSDSNQKLKIIEVVESNLKLRCFVENLV